MSKSTGLSGGDEITVTWTGFRPGPAAVLQCQPAPLSRDTGCVARNRVRALTAADGTGSATIRLRVDVSTLAAGTLRCYRDNPCSVVVTECAFDLGAGRAASTPISFDELPEFDDDGVIIGGGGDPPTLPPPVEPPAQEPPPTSRPTVTGGGSESITLATDVWGHDIRFAPIAAAGVDYTPLNSPSGLGSKDPETGLWTGFVGGKFDFALSGIPLAGEQRKELEDQKRGAVLVPLVANALTFIVNGRVGSAPAPITDLNLSATTAHDLYAGGKDLSLNAAEVVRDNFGCRIHTEFQKVFQPVYRGDQSADNLTLTSWLKADTGASRFPVDTRLFGASSSESRQGNEGLAFFIAYKEPADATGSGPLEGRPFVRLGYVGLAYARKHGLTVVAVKNKYGAFVLPTAESVGKAVKGAKVQEDGSLSFDRTDPDPGVYPLTSVTYAVVPTTLTSSFTAEEGAVLRDYLTYAISPQGQAKAASLGYFGLPPELLKQAGDAIAKIPASAAAPATEVAPEASPVAGGDLGGFSSGGFEDAGSGSPSSGDEGGAAPTDGDAAPTDGDTAAPPAPAPEQPKRPVPIGASRLLQGGGLVPPLPLLFALGLLLLAAGRITSRRATPRG